MKNATTATQDYH